MAYPGKAVAGAVVYGLGVMTLVVALVWRRSAPPAASRASATVYIVDHSISVGSREDVSIASVRDTFLYLVSGGVGGGEMNAKGFGEAGGVVGRGDSSNSRRRQECILLWSRGSVPVVL